MPTCATLLDAIVIAVRTNPTDFTKWAEESDLTLASLLDGPLSGLSDTQKKWAAREIGDLPSAFGTILVDATYLAVKAGKEIFASSPELKGERREEFAGKGRVRLTVDFDEAGVSITLEHPGAKDQAKWYTPAESPDLMKVRVGGGAASAS